MRLKGRIRLLGTAPGPINRSMRGERVVTGLLSALAILVGLLGAPSAAAQSTPVPVPGAPSDFSTLSDRLMPAVVNIATTQRVEGIDEAPRFPRGSPLERFNELFDDQGLREVNSLGSGFIISADGVIVTNNHVIDQADQIEVVFQDGERLTATVVGRDPATDLAVLRVQAGRALPFVRWGDSDGAKVGEWVIAIGNPFGLGGSVSAGIISARNRNIAATDYDDFIQTDAAINRGNSGGPLFNMRGEVIGVNTAIVSPTGASVGVGFATPSDLARSVVQQLLQFGETRRGWIGVYLAPVTQEAAKRAGLARVAGALVRRVTDAGPAARAGLRPGDIVLTYDGRAVSDARQMTRLVVDSAVGRTVTIEYQRAGRRFSTTVEVQRLAEAGAGASAPRNALEENAPGDIAGAQGRVAGLTLAELSPSLRRRFDIDPELRGLVVLGVDPRSDASGKIEVGDVIVEMSFEAVETLSQARALATRAERERRPLLVYLSREGEMTFRSVRPRR